MGAGQEDICNDHSEKGVLDMAWEAYKWGTPAKWKAPKWKAHKSRVHKGKSSQATIARRGY